MKFFLFVVTFLYLAVPVLHAWGLEIGYQRLMPKLGTKEQEYQSQTGQKITLTPRVEETILGQAYTIGLKLEEYLIQYEQVDYAYSTTIPAAALSTTQDTVVDSQINEKRLGLNYHLERDLAGIFLGVGITVIEEKLISIDNEWIYTGATAYLKYGLDMMIMSMLKVRAEQIHFRIGVHNAAINSFGLVFYF